MADEYIKRSDAIALIVGGNKLISKAWLMNALATTPAADVAPVKHGRWIADKWGEHFCSECGKYAIDRGVFDSGEILTDYAACAGEIAGKSNNEVDD